MRRYGPNRWTRLKYVVVGLVGGGVGAGLWWVARGMPGLPPTPFILQAVLTAALGVLGYLWVGRFRYRIDDGVTVERPWMSDISYDAAELRAPVVDQSLLAGRHVRMETAGAPLVLPAAEPEELQSELAVVLDR